MRSFLFFTFFLCISMVCYAESKPKSQTQSHKEKSPFEAGKTGVETKIVKKPVVNKAINNLPTPKSLKAEVKTAPKIQSISQESLKKLSLPMPTSLSTIYRKVEENAQVRIENYVKKTEEIIERVKPKTNIQLQQESPQKTDSGSVFDLVNKYNVPLERFVKAKPENKIVNNSIQQKPITMPIISQQKIITPQVADRITLSALPSKPIIKKARKAVVVIDPGHGGKDPGATGKLGNREKNIVLAYSRALRDELNRTGKYIVKMTRDNDSFVPLPDRVKIARRSGGDILISIHADSNPNKEVRGFSIYTISKDRAEREARKLLEKSEYEEIIRGVPLKGKSRDVKEALIFISQNETKDISDELSRILAKNMGKKAKPLPKSNREASLAVLTGADIPSVLLELGYMSNIYEERLLATAQHKQKVVSSIVAAIDEYFRTYNYLLE
ncbi:MAG: N-acetylmuramoyl-L-alanine amidase [Rickettsiales bacterium]|nr:N-acetylmuramoyl-L-alanine amidase [Rickettsiales bacterium]